MPQESDRSLSRGAIPEALVFHGRIHYRDDRGEVDVSNIRAVMVGSWTADGDEETADDRVSTYTAAIHRGYKPQWLPTGPDNAGYDLLIVKGYDGLGVVQSYTEQEADTVVKQVNEAYEHLKRARG